LPLELYSGDRRVDAFDLDLHGGKARLNCTIIERWEERFSRVLKCGNKRREVVTQKLGISSEERRHLEAQVKGSLGLSGIAELKSEIAGKIETRIELQESTEVQKEFTFEAPECGRLDLTCYQLRRIYRFRCEDTRFWHENWTGNVSEWVDRIYDKSRRYPYDPDCGFKPKSEPKIDGEITLVLDEKIAIDAGFSRTDEEISIPELDLSLSGKNIDQVLFGRLRLQRSVVPPHLLFLAGVTAEMLTVRVIPSVTDRVAGTFQERDHRRQFATERKKLGTSAGLGYFVTGACIGAALGVLFAPKASDKTGEYLASKADEGREYTLRRAREMRDRAKELIERSKEIMQRQRESISTPTSEEETTERTYKKEIS
jgi:gas vesicle protein